MMQSGRSIALVAVRAALLDVLVDRRVLLDERSRDGTYASGW
jgi:hypothetical protein